MKLKTRAGYNEPTAFPTNAGGGKPRSKPKVNIDTSLPDKKKTRQTN